MLAFHRLPDFVFLTVMPLVTVACAGSTASLPQQPGPRAASAQPAAPACLRSQDLARALADSLTSIGFAELWDTERHATIARLPNVDLAVIAFPGSMPSQSSCAPAMANVLLSADAPQGHVVALAEDTLTAAVTWRKWSYDRWNGVIPWDAPWPEDSAIVHTTGSTTSALDFMSPHPASVFKLQVAVGVMLGVDSGAISLHESISTALPEPFGSFAGTVDQAMTQMITVSSNSATTALIARLHAAGILPDRLASTMDALGLHTLQLRNTQPDGRWRPPEGTDTTGAFNMTAWDTARLLWLLDTDFRGPASAPSWLVNGAPVNTNFLSAASKAYLRGLLERQALHESLSSTATCGIQGRAPGIPARLSETWLTNPAQGDFSLVVDGIRFGPDIRPCNAEAEVVFAHKTGLTHNFGSDAGIVRGTGAHHRHYIIVLLSNLGERYTDAPLLQTYPAPCKDAGLCYSQRIPALGLVIDTWLEQHLEGAAP